MVLALVLAWGIDDQANLIGQTVRNRELRPQTPHARRALERAGAIAELSPTSVGGGLAPSYLGRRWP